MLRLLAFAAALAVCVAEGTFKVKRIIGDGFKLHSIYELFDKAPSHLMRHVVRTDTDGGSFLETETRHVVPQPNDNRKWVSNCKDTSTKNDLK
jgi:hypothetical protein